MIEIPFSVGMVLLLCGWTLFRLTAFLHRKQINWKYEGIQLFFLVNLAVIFRFAFFPFSTVNGQIQPLIFDVATAFPFRINLVPFVNLLDYDSSFDLLINIIGNFAMFIPTGILLPLIYKPITTFQTVFLTGAAISFVIEIIQLPFAVRASDIDDFILNTAGCLVGYCIYSANRWFRSKCIKNMENPACETDVL